MLRYRLLIFLSLLALAPGGTSVTAATPAASPMATPVSMECEAVEQYLRTIESLQLEASEGFEEPLSRDPSKLKPAQQREIAGMLRELATEMDAMGERDVPALAGEYHQAIIEALDLMADAYDALASNNAVKYLRLSDEVEAALDRVDSARDGIEAACGLSSTPAGETR